METGDDIAASQMGLPLIFSDLLLLKFGVDGVHGFMNPGLPLFVAGGAHRTLDCLEVWGVFGPFVESADAVVFMVSRAAE